MHKHLPLYDLVGHLRDHIVGALHVGSLEPGARLPSIRTVARERGCDERRVARAYRMLEAEGLVLVRGRSGVYAAPQPRLGGGMMEQTAEWLASVLLEGWKRRIPIEQLPELLHHCAHMKLRCAFVDSCYDTIEAFGHELREELGFQVTRVLVPHPPHESRLLDDEATLVTELGVADVVVTTSFTATVLHGLVQRLAKPMVTVSVDPRTVAAIVDHLRQRPLTIVCVDPSFGDRIRLEYETWVRDEEWLRVVLASDAAAVGALDPNETVLLTRAARDRLGPVSVKLLVPHSPTLSPSSAGELITFLVRENSQRVMTASSIAV
jgi:DNA-binding transcriptional regulator YhcF (GntR family)